MISLLQIQQQVSVCEKCPELASQRTKTVFGTGPVPATLLFLGEAPGYEEDKEGKPFVGQAGRLLTNIIKACGWNREDIYIANILKCRPPNNRRPTKEEACNCRPFLDTQIQAVSPKWIVCWGATAASNLLGVEPFISSLRGTVYSHKESRVICTYHPAFLLRNSSAKKEVWEDLQVVIADLKAMGASSNGVVRHKDSTKSETLRE